MDRVPSSKNTLLWIVAIGFFMDTLDTTIVNTALPAMAHSLGEDPLAMHSVVMAYSLALAVFIPVSGWVADRFGIRQTFLAAIAIFVLGSILCAFSPNLNFLIASRLIQGIGGSMLMPVGRLAILRVFPHDQFLIAMSFAAVPALIGPLIGPTLGGFLVQVASWHWIFLINLPVGIAGVYATLKYMPEIPTYAVPKFDLRGFAMLATMMVSISLSLEWVSDPSLGRPVVGILFATGLIAFVSYVFHASRHRHALFQLSLFKVRTFAIGLVGNLFARVGTMAMPFLIPLFLQINLGYSPLRAGATMIPVALVAVLSRRFATRLILRAGYRRFLVINTLLLGTSIALFSLMGPAQDSTMRLLQLVLFGFLNSLQFSAMNSLTLKDLESSGTGSGNSLLSMVQMLAMSFGVANAGALLALFNRHFDEQGLPPLMAFHATFICLGAVTCVSALIFAQLKPDGVIRGRVPPIEPEMG